MAIFMDTGGGDIYAGPTREAVLAAMRSDGVFEDYPESAVFDVPGSNLACMADEDESPTGEFVPLESVYSEGLGAYLIATTNT